MPIQRRIAGSTYRYKRPPKRKKRSLSRTGLSHPAASRSWRPWKEILTMPLLLLKIGFIALAAILAVELGMIAAEWDEQRQPQR